MGEGSGVMVGVRVGVEVEVGVDVEVGARRAAMVPGVHSTKIPVPTRQARMMTAPKTAMVILFLLLPC